MTIFRIRSNKPDDEEQMKQYREYLDFIDRFNRNEHHDLWSFFATEFFHDGQIGDIHFSPDLGSLSLKVACPNIRRRSGGKWSCVDPVWFACKFDGVASFHMGLEKPDEEEGISSVNDATVLFLESEINSLTEEIAEAEKTYRDAFHSIIIKTLPSQRSFSLVFRGVRVEPAEPLAFELMKKSGDFEVPLFVDARSEE